MLTQSGHFSDERKRNAGSNEGYADHEDPYATVIVDQHKRRNLQKLSQSIDLATNSNDDDRYCDEVEPVPLTGDTGPPA